ncbi:MAG: signal peptidase I [Candidatus Omnitrophica bacterium]|nr:signal peptidase I [Candidatus Omnitrophota bacterium]
MNFDINKSSKFDELILLLKEGISKSSNFEFQVISDSMSPLLKSTDKVSVKPVTVNELFCGDIVIFKIKEKLVVHRFLYRKGQDQFVTKGDNLSYTDNPINNDDLIAKVLIIKKGDFTIDLKEPIWKRSNRFLSKISILQSRYSSKNIFANLTKLILKLILFFINKQFRKISKIRVDYSLEKNFLLISSKKELTATDKQRLKKMIIKKEIDWNQIITLALYNNIAPIIYRNLSQFDSELVPEETMETLKSYYTESFLKTAPLFSDISKLLKEFNILGLKVIALKGCSLAEQLYQDFSLRPMKDVDILVKKDDWPQIKLTLSKFNFKSIKDPLELNLLAGISIDQQIGYENKNQTKIEFKFNLFILDFPDFNTKDYWQDCIKIKVGGIDTYSLSVENQIVYLSSRMISCGFRNLLWFCDLRELINTYKEKINWEKIIIKAREKKVTVALYNSLLILDKELSVDIPEEVLTAFKPTASRQKLFSIFYGLENALFATPEGANYPNPLISLCLLFGKFNLRIKDVSKLLRYVSKIFFPSAKYIVYRYDLPERTPAIFYWYFHRIKIFLMRFLNLGRIINTHIFSLIKSQSPSLLSPFYRPIKSKNAYWQKYYRKN